MPEWLTTLLAVLAGGVLTYVVQAKLDERRSERDRVRDAEADRRAQAREREAEEAEFRVAKRVFLEDLDTIALHHALLAEVAQYPLERAGQVMFPTEAWESEKRTLASGIASDDVWNALIRFMHTATRVKVLVLHAEPHSAIPPELLQQFREGATLASDLYEALAGVRAPSVTTDGGVAVLAGGAQLVPKPTSEEPD